MAYMNLDRWILRDDYSEKRLADGVQRPSQFQQSGAHRWADARPPLSGRVAEFSGQTDGGCHEEHLRRLHRVRVDGAEAAALVREDGPHRKKRSAAG